MKKTVSFLRNLIGIVAVFFALFMACTLLEKLPYERVNPLSDLSLEQWLESYKAVLVYTFGIGLGLTLLWYVLEEWVIRPQYKKARSSRFRWGIFLLVQVIVLAAVILYTSRKLPADGAEIVYIFYVLATVVPYYLTTLFFSPSAVKYTVPLSRKLRFW